MKLAEGSRVITMARAPHDEDEEISAIEDDSTAERAWPKIPQRRMKRKKPPKNN